MSNSPSPSLPSTADAVPYVPVSWLAVAALAVAGAFAVTLAALALVAFTSKKQLLEDWLLVMPVIAIVLSFAARRVIRNSEGTRTGEALANYAWWTSVVLGLCYVAYLFGVDFAVRRDARAEVTKWMDAVVLGTPEGDTQAFYRTIPPGQRQSGLLQDQYQMETRYGNELLSFTNTDLLRLARRNRGEFEFVPDAVNWVHKPGAVEGTLLGKAKCPEGTFPLAVPFKGLEGVTGVEGGGGRQWMIAWQAGGGFIDQARASRTEYGWLLAVLEADGGAFGRAYISQLAGGSSNHLFTYRAFVAPGGDLQGWSAMSFDRIAQLAFAAPARVALGDAGYADYMANNFYRRKGGADAGADYKARFFNSFNAQGLRQAGDKLKDASGAPIDKDDTIAVTDAAVEVRVPIEIPIVGTGKIEAARGRLLVTCSDPAVMAEVKGAKASANPAAGTTAPPDTLDALRKKAVWRVVRVESDMVPVSTAPPSGPGRGPPG